MTYEIFNSFYPKILHFLQLLINTKQQNTKKDTVHVV